MNCECKRKEKDKKLLQEKLMEFEKLKSQVSFLAGQISLLQELTRCECEGDCDCATETNATKK